MLGTTGPTCPCFPTMARWPPSGSWPRCTLVDADRYAENNNSDHGLTLLTYAAEGAAQAVTAHRPASLTTDRNVATARKGS